VALHGVMLDDTQSRNLVQENFGATSCKYSRVKAFTTNAVHQHLSVLVIRVQVVCEELGRECFFYSTQEACFSLHVSSASVTQKQG